MSGTCENEAVGAQLSRMVTGPTAQGVGEDTEIRKGTCSLSWVGVGRWQSQISLNTLTLAPTPLPDVTRPQGSAEGSWETENI